MRCCAEVLAAAVLAARAAAAPVPVMVLSDLEPPRSRSLGGAVAAVGLDPALAGVNPAATAAVRAPSLTLGSQAGRDGGFLGGGSLTFPLPAGALTVGGKYYDAGTIVVAAADGAETSLPARRDFEAFAGLAAPWGERAAVGGNLKMVGIRMLDRYEADAAAADVGVQFRMSPHVKAGLFARDVGPRFTLLADGLSLPARVQGGLAGGAAAEELFGDGAPAGIRLLATLDASVPVATRSAAWLAGAEVQIRERLAARGGVRLDPAEGARWNAGFGVRLGLLRLDYAVQAAGPASPRPQSVSLTGTL